MDFSQMKKTKKILAEIKKDTSGEEIEQQSNRPRSRYAKARIHILFLSRNKFLGQRKNLQKLTLTLYSKA